MSSSSLTEPRRQKGKLKVFLGYAAGVGKTYQMLAEAQVLKLEGVDVVVGYFEPHARPDTIAQLVGLEVIPRKIVEYRGIRLEEMDTAAIIARHPQLCLVDEFPHTNAPGSERAKRWEDVFLLLENGCDVFTTMNVQHLESLNDHIRNITGVAVRETVPDWVVQHAAEVVMVDLTPRALLNRLERGVVYNPEKAQQAKLNFFKESTLVALRELALRETAFEVESRNTNAIVTGRVLIYIAPGAAAATLIRRGKRVADYLQTECLAVAVLPGDEAGADEKTEIENQLKFASSLRIETHLLSARDPVNALVSFARQHGVTQIYLLRPDEKSWRAPFTRNFVQRVARLAYDMEVTIVAQRSAPDSSRASAGASR
jgi:two-component system, OmpR family, sensor histidine kinase KdpD